MFQQSMASPSLIMPPCEVEHRRHRQLRPSRPLRCHQLRRNHQTIHLPGVFDGSKRKGWCSDFEDALNYSLVHSQKPTQEIEFRSSHMRLQVNVPDPVVPLRKILVDLRRIVVYLTMHKLIDLAAFSTGLHNLHATLQARELVRGESPAKCSLTICQPKYMA